MHPDHNSAMELKFAEGENNVGIHMKIKSKSVPFGSKALADSQTRNAGTNIVHQ